MEIQNILLAWSWEHVQGHQDDEHEVLTIMKQRNIDMDVAAKAHWAQHHTQRQGTPIQFFGKGWRIFLGQKN